MYRFILPLLLCACAVRCAPQDSDKLQSTVSDEPAYVTRSEESFGKVTAGAPESDELVRRARQGSATTGPGDADTAGTEPAVTETEANTAPRTSARTFTRAPRPARPSPRFISKLSYFNRASAPSDGETNLLERPYKGYRKFTSSCRCEKIWNCPRLQITVPRCPDEYFLCCDL